MVSNVQLLSWKHKTPSDLSVVLDTYTENPINRAVKPFVGPKWTQKKSKTYNEKKQLCIYLQARVTLEIVYNKLCILFLQSQSKFKK